MTTHSVYVSEPELKKTRRTSAGLIGMVTLLLAGTLNAAPGLSISLHHNRVYPTTVESYFMGGTNGTYTINVVNSGPATTGLITVTDTLPDALTFVSAVGDNWNCSAASGTVTCTTMQSIPNLGTSSSILLTVLVAPRFGPGSQFFQINRFDGDQPATAVINNAATVTAANASIDNGTQVDVAPDAFPVGPGLVVQIVPNAGLGGVNALSSTFTGSTGSYSIVLLNLNSAATVNPISISVGLPAGMTAVGGIGDNWVCSSASCTYSASIGALASSSVLDLLVGFAPSVSGFIQAHVAITDAGGAPVAQGTAGDLGVNVVPLANSKDGTLTRIQATPNPTFAGVPVTITTTTQLVSGGAPSSGTVSFSISAGAAFSSIPGGVASLPVQPVNIDNNGQTSFVTAFPAGEYVITASFSGDANTNPSTATYVQRIDVPTTGPVISGSVYSFCNTNPLSITNPGSALLSAFVAITNPDPLNIFVHDLPGTVQTVQVDLRNAHLLSAEAVLIGPARRNDNFAFFGDPLEFQFGSFSFTDNGASLLGPPPFPFPAGTIEPGIYQPLVASDNRTLLGTGIIYTALPQIGMDYNAFFPFAGDKAFKFPVMQGTDTFTSVFGNGNPNGVWTLAFGDMDLIHTSLGSLDAWCLDLTLNLPDVQLSGTNGPQFQATGSFTTGGSGSYQITAHNNGPGSTSGAAGSASQITVALDSHLTYVSGSGPNWTCPGSGGASVTCTYNYPIAAGQDFPPLTINVGVSNTAPASVTSTATFSGGGDGTPSNNSASVTTSTTSSSSAALLISKVHNGGAFTNLQNGSYSITVENAGQAATTSTVTVTDVLPPGLSFVSATGTNWNCGSASGTVTCTNTAAIPANGFSSAITLTVSVNTSAASILNVATVNGGSGTVVQGAGIDTVPITPAPPAPANLSISIIHQPAAAFTSGFISGQNGVYTVTVQNSGGPTTTGVTVTSPISGGFVSVGVGWVCVVDQFTLKLICTSLGAIPAGGSSVFNLTYAINTTATSITNTVTVTGGGGAIGTGTASDTATVLQPGLSISKVHNGTAFVNGNTGSYAIKVQNNNLTATSSAIVVQDTLPAGLTFITGAGTGWSCQVVTGVVTCINPQAVPPGSVASTLTLSFSINSIAPTIQNTATLSGGGVPLGASSSTDVVPVTQSQPALTISKVHNGSVFVNGSTGSYTITVQNSGTPTNSLITVTDPLPAALTFSNASGTDWNCTFNSSSNTVTCQTSDVVSTNGVSNPITITVRPNTMAASIQNTASVSGGGGVIAVASSTDTVALSTAVATLTKVHNGTSFVNGQNGTYTVTVQNLSATPIGTFKVADSLPAGLSLVSAGGTNWSCGLAGVENQLQCDNFGIPGNSSSSFTITVAVNTTSTSIQNTASIVSGALPPLTSTDTVTVTGQPGLVISKVHNGTSFLNGQNGTYTIAVQNNMFAATTTGIVVQDSVPAGLAVVGAAGTGWDCSATTFATAVCRYGTIPAVSTTNPLTITVNVTTSAASISNTATLSGGGTNIGIFSSTDTVNVTQPGIAISKVHNGTAFTNGQNGSYSITLQNTQSTATSSAFTITDHLPSGLTFVSASGAGWICPAPSGGVVTCSYSLTIPGNGTSNPLTLTTAVNTTFTSIQNVAEVLLPAEGNPSSIDTVTVKQPGLAISNVHDGGSFNNNQNGSYTISIANTGAATTGTVTVSDALPAGLSFVSGSGASWSCAAPGGSNVTCTRSVPIPANATTAIALVVAVNSSAPTLSTTANLSGGGGTISVPSSTDIVSITQPPPALAISATHNGTFMNGQNGTLTISVTNSGGATLPGNTVSVHDIMPTGLSIVSASGTNWSCGGGSGVMSCNSTNPLPANSTSTITVTVAVNTTAASLIHAPTLTGGGGSILVPSATDTIFITQPASLTISSLTNGFFVNHQNGGFTIIVQNSGGPTTAPVTVTGGPLPAGLTLVSATGTGWNCSSSTSSSISCQIPSIAGGATANVVVVVAINTAAPTIDIPLTVSGGGGGIPVPNNDFLISIGAGTAPAPKVVAFNVVWGSQSYNLFTSVRNRLPWLITGIQVQFTTPIANAGLNSITGITATGISGLGTDTITWTFSPISIGTFTTAILASGASALTDVNGNKLAHEFDQTFKILTGDVNDDGAVSSADVVLVNNAIPAPYSLIYDVNGDGVVNTADVILVRGKLNNKLP